MSLSLDKKLAIVKQFDSHDIEFQSIENDIWIPLTHIALALGYKNPQDSAKKVFSRNQEELEHYSRWGQIDTPSGKQMARLLNEQGVYIFSMLARTRRAKDFRAWVANILTELRNKHISLLQNESQTLLQQYTDFESHYNNRLLIIEKIVLKETKLVARKYQLAKKRAELAYLIANHGIPLRSAHSRTWLVLKKEYQFTKFADMPSVYYSDAIAFLQNIIDEIKREKHLPLYLYYNSELDWVKGGKI